ncbi:MAG: phospholipase D-like domain-containing protein [Bacteroidales bacterium]|jgi:phosphatidylserine/phosphatidylglycerophosphate/cardiolipin synthase-like enzyme
MKTQAYFDNIQEQIIMELDSARSSIIIAVAWFTDEKLFETLCHLADKGIKIELLLINDQINQTSGIKYKLLQEKGSKVWMIGGNDSRDNIMHNKFCVIDQSTIISGSYNWTKKAKNNYESITIIKDNPLMAMDFITEFQQIIEKYFGKDVESMILNYGKICVRLETLKNVILLEDFEDIKYQLDKLKNSIKTAVSDTNTDNLTSIIKKTERKNYGEAVRLINEFTTRFRQLTIYIDSEIAALKLESRSLELQINALDDEKTEIEKLLHSFEIRHNQELGDIIVKILRIRKEKLKNEAKKDTTKKKEHEEAEKDYDDFNQNYSTLKDEKIAELSDDDKKELKVLYRKASMLCHPDKVAEDQKTEAERIFKELSEAYKRNDLEKVKDILTNLEKGVFLSNTDITNEKEKLLILVQQLRIKRDHMEQELDELRKSETYKTVSSIDDWDEYFKNLKENLNNQLVEEEAAILNS